MFSRVTKDPILRRLLPLYIAAFSQGFILWYAVEKLFMREIGFTDATIGVMGAAYAVIVLLTETPSGILADRWSRKGVLIIGSLALIISSLICGFSTSVDIYIIGALFWGIFYALYSGTYDSIIYDTLLEETGKSNRYEHYYGLIKLSDGLALVAGALIGGVIGSIFGLAETFIWSVPLTAISILALLAFREPQLHKSEMSEPIMRHIKTTFRAVMQRGALIEILIVLVLGAALMELIMEYGQLWFMFLATPVFLYGPLYGILLGGFGIAGLLTEKMRLHQKGPMLTLAILMFISALCLIFVQSLPVVILAQLILTMGLIASGIIFLHRLHDRLPSKVRTGASSAVSTLTRTLFIPFSLAFGWISSISSPFAAGWLLLIPLLLVCWLLVQDSKKQPQQA